jgi:hypothetical protein
MTPSDSDYVLIEQITSRIKNLFLEESSDPFKGLDPNDLEGCVYVKAAKLFEGDDLGDLQCAIYVSTKFHFYLASVNSTEYPVSGEDGTFGAGYYIGTIQSGFDSIFRVLSIYNILKGSSPRKISVQDIETFASFKKLYMEKFAKLQEADLPLHERLGYLIDLGKMQICFVGLSL